MATQLKWAIPEEDNRGLLSTYTGNISKVPGLLGTPVAAPAPVGIAVAPQTQTNDGLTTYTAGQAATQQAGYQTADPYLRTVDANTETVQGQLKGLLTEGSPLLERARSKAAEEASGRGIYNSSVAIGAGEGAMYDTAIQIATPDAATYGQSARDNQGVLNQTGQFNADAFNRNQQFNAGEANTTSRFNTGESNTASRFGADAGNQLNLTNINNREQMNRLTYAEAQAMNRLQVSEAGATSRSAAQNATSVQIAGMSNENRIAVANLEANNRALIQGNATAGQIYSQMQSNIARINTDPGLTSEGKANAVNWELQSAQNGMAIAGSVANIDFGQTIDWNAARVVAPAPAPAPTAAPATSPAPSGEPWWLNNGPGTDG